MHFTIKILLFLLPLLITTEEPLMTWEEGYKLNWEDFQGKIPKQTQFAASTQSGLYFSYSVQNTNGNLSLTTLVTANFNPKESWFKPDKVNAIILSHEQGHFDITEIQARKLRKEFSNYKVTKNYKNDLQSMYTKAENDRKAMQMKYDKETNHSIILEKQKEWNNFIQKELSRFDSWK